MKRDYTNYRTYYDPDTFTVRRYSDDSALNCSDLGDEAENTATIEPSNRRLLLVKL